MSKMSMLLSCLLVPCLASCPDEPLARRKEADPSSLIVGLFDVHEGERCHLLRPGGVERVLTAAAALERGLAQGNGSGVGFEIYDTCSSPSVSLRHLMRSLACPRTRFIGVIGPKSPEIQAQVSPFLKALGIPYVPLQVTSLLEEVQALTKVLSDLRWKVVAVVASNSLLLDEFRQAADASNICIVSSTTILDRQKLEDAPVAVILGSGVRLRDLQGANSSVHHWLLAGTDEEDAPLFSPTILFRKAARPPAPFDPRLEASYEFGDRMRRLNLVRSYEEFVRRCNVSGCASDPSGHRAEEAVRRVLDILREAGELEPLDVNQTDRVSFGGSDRVEIWTYQQARLAQPLAKHRKILVGHFSDGRLDWDKKVLNVFQAMGSGWFKIPEFHCQPDCRDICENFERLSPDPPDTSLWGRVYHRWRHEAWVSVLLTVSSVGALAALLTAVFLLLRSCGEDSGEGSQASSLLLLAACLFCYGCTLLFAFDRDVVACRARVAVVGLAHASLLAPPLSRVLLLINEEREGVHSHLSGFLQGVLCAALAAPQIAMAAYFWLAPSAAGGSPFRCTYEAGPTLGYLSYGALLSLCWLVASPFCARSRRGHREGLLLHLCGAAVALSWLASCLLLLLLHPRWSEFAICLGSVAAPSAVLAALFAPKVYRAVVATAARRHGSGHATLQPVVFASTSSRSPNLSIYESVNHGFNPDKDVFGDEEESPRPHKMTHL